jgi:hypothetical protein
MTHTGSSRRFRLPAPEDPESFAVLADERFRLHDHQCIAPLEQSAQGSREPPRGIAGPARLDFQFLEERELLSKEQVLCRQGTAVAKRKRNGPYRAKPRMT